MKKKLLYTAGFIWILLLNSLCGAYASQRIDSSYLFQLKDSIPQDAAVMTFHFFIYSIILLAIINMWLDMERMGYRVFVMEKTVYNRLISKDEKTTTTASKGLFERANIFMMRSGIVKKPVVIEGMAITDPKVYDYTPHSSDNYNEKLLEVLSEIIAKKKLPVLFYGGNPLLPHKDYSALIDNENLKKMLKQTKKNLYVKSSFRPHIDDLVYWASKIKRTRGLGAVVIEKNHQTNSKKAKDFHWNKEQIERLSDVSNFLKVPVIVINHID